MDGKAVFLSLIACVLLSGCQRRPESSEVQPQKSIPAQSAAVAPSTVVTPSPVTVPSGATGNIAYDKVMSKLEAGGVGYLYWSAERIFGELSKKFGPVSDAVSSDPDLTPSEKEQIRKCFDLARRCTAASGIENLKAFGFSSREAEPGIFLNKSFLYAPDRSGFLWDTFAKRPHDFAELEMVPTKAEGFAFYDFDLPLLWRAIIKELNASETPEVTRWEKQISQQVQSSSD
jgi:hypothetical protein